jgi:hypothetical protein
MNRLSVVLLISALFFLGASAQTTEPIQNTANGHCYWVVSSSVNAFNFSTALADAASRTSNGGAPGYLATITTAAEENFIATLISATSVSYYTGALANAAGTDYVWQAGDEAGVVVFNASGCQQATCFSFTGPVSAGSALSLFNNTFVSNSDSLLLGYIIEFNNCTASPSATASPSNPTTTTTTGASPSNPTTTAGATVSPSTFRPTITLGTLTTTGKKTTTGRKATSSSTTGRRATTGKVSAASSMSFSAVAVAIAAASMMFLRR